MLVIEAPRSDQSIAHSQLSLDDRDGARAQGDPTILTRLGHVPINAPDSSLRDAQDAVRGIVVGHHQGNRLGGSKPGKEAQRIVVTLGFAPILMQGGDWHLRILDAERIDHWPILLADPGTPE